MYKRASILILISYLAFSCESEINNFNEWSELNLKNNPKEIIEISSHSPTALFALSDSLFEWWIEEPVKEWFNYRIISFDSCGFIKVNEIHSPVIDNISCGKYGERIKTRVFKEDSLIIKSFYEKLPENYSEKIYILNENKIPIKKIESNGNVAIIDSFKRDKKNRIIEIYSKGNGIDDSFESITNFSLNEFGDPIQKIIIGKTIMYNSMDTLSYHDTVLYNYIYDESNNWILKTISGNQKNVNLIVQRSIKY